MTRPSPRVVVTGVGVVSGWGWGSQSFWKGICSAESSVRPITRFDSTGFPTHLAAEVPEPPAALAAGVPDWHRLSRADRYVVASTREALSQARLAEDLSGLRAGVFLGSSTAGLFESEEFFAALTGTGENNTPSRPSLRLLTYHQLSGPADAVAHSVKVTGPVQTISSACASATLAIGTALDAIRDGFVNLAIAGGSDSLCRITYGGFNSLQAVDEKPCLPFRQERAGLNLGEGGAALILESLDAAEKRGVTPLAELAGTGASADAHHMTAPDPEGTGAALALERVLDDAGVSPDEVDFINAHGTGTPLNDVSEFKAFQRVFGARASTIPVTSTKGSVGHLLGSAGAVEAAATVFCLEKQFVHPTPGPGEVDPQAPVNLVRGNGLADPNLETGISLNLGFGGCNGALFFCRQPSS